MFKSSKYTDMTQGSPFRLILFFAIPMFIGNIFQQIYSVADTMVAGYCLGDTAIAAIGATGSLFSLIINFAWGMNSGFGLVVTRAFGSKDNEKLRKSIAGMITLNTVITLVLSILALVFLKPLMNLINTPDEIYHEAYIYIFILFAGMLSTILYNMFASVLRSVGNSRTPLYFLIISNLTNMAMDILLVAVFKTGIAGAAIATVFSQTMSAVLSGLYLFRKYSEIMPQKEDFGLNKELISDLVSNGAAMAFMLCVVDLGSVIYQGATNSLGDMIIAAHTSSKRIISIFMTPLSTIAGASTTFVGQNYGAKRYDRIKHGIRTAAVMEISWAVVFGLVLFFFGGFFVRLLTGTKNGEIIFYAVLSLKIHVQCFSALGILLVLRTALQAMGRKMVTIVSSSLELIMKIIAAYILIPKYHFIGTSITEPITWVLCMTFLLVIYLTQRKKLYHEK